MPIVLPMEHLLDLLIRLKEHLIGHINPAFDKP